MNPIYLKYGNNMLLDQYYRPVFRYGQTSIGGRTYLTVQLGDQEWLAENLDWVPEGITDQGSSTASVTVPSAWHYTDPDFDSGAFYNGPSLPVLRDHLEVAVLCDAGWRVPSVDDMMALCYRAGADVNFYDYTEDPDVTYDTLLASKYWTSNTGTDNFGMSLLPTGFRFFNDGSRRGRGNITNLWTISASVEWDAEPDDLYRITVNMPYGSTGVFLTTAIASVPGMTNGFNVRLVRTVEDAARKVPLTTKIGGKFYRTITVDGLEWMAEPLDLDDGGAGIVTKDGGAYGGTKYYTYEAAARVVATAGYDWRLPSAGDVAALAGAVGGVQGGNGLKSNYGWKSGRNGTDTIGFTALPCGIYSEASGTIIDTGERFAFKGAQVEQGITATYSLVDNSGILIEGTATEGTGHTLRLVRDLQFSTTVIDGKTYRTVTIGNQEWLAENLQLNDGGTGVMTFNNGSYSDGEIIYRHTAARRVAALVGDGWRLPTNADIEELCSKTGITLLSDSGEEDPERTYEVLLNTTDWPAENGTDLYGFNLLPVGFNADGSYFDDRGTTNFWSYDASGSKGYHFIINYGTPVVRHGAYLATWGSTTCYYSVRLVRDAGANKATIGGRTYNTVAIDGREWITENLDWRPSGITYYSTPRGNWPTNSNKACTYYNNDSTLGYGLLYNWSAASYLDGLLTDGWRVPTKTDFLSLISAARDGRSIKSESGWYDEGNGLYGDGNGTNEYLFNGKPGGMVTGHPSGSSVAGGSYTLANLEAVFWCITASGKDNEKLNLNLRYDRDEAFINSGYPTHGMSIRLVRDI